MMVLPYRAKNPPQRLPVVTYGLIAANIAVYACTTDYFLVAQKGAVETLGFSNDHASLLRMLTAMFLHGNLLHLVGNMLFLWIFGPAVEGRLGPVRFLLLYLLTGLAGDLLQMVTIGQANPHLWNLGASGAIMGIAGAYLYMFPFATVCVFYQYWYRFGLADWAAQWVILYFLGFDLIDGILYQGMDGVGHFAHIGGAILGFLLPLLLRMPRDSEDASTAQAIRNDARGDDSILALHELEALIENRPGDIGLLVLFCQKAIMRSEMNGPQRAMEIIKRHSDALLTKADPATVAHILLTMPEAAGPAPASLMMRLSAKLEAAGDASTASACYRRFYNDNPESPDAQTSLVRWARLTEQLDADKRNAAALYIELLRRFPNGSQAMYAESALRRLGVDRPRFTLSAGDSAATGEAAPAAETPPAASTGTTAPTMGTVGDFASPLTPRVAEEARPATEPGHTPPVWETSYRVGETRGMVLSPIGGGTPAAAEEPA